MASFTLSSVFCLPSLCIFSNAFFGNDIFICLQGFHKCSSLDNKQNVTLNWKTFSHLLTYSCFCLSCARLSRIDLIIKVCNIHEFRTIKCHPLHHTSNVQSICKVFLFCFCLFRRYAEHIATTQNHLFHLQATPNKREHKKIGYYYYLYLYFLVNFCANKMFVLVVHLQIVKEKLKLFSAPKKKR